MTEFMLAMLAQGRKDVLGITQWTMFKMEISFFKTNGVCAGVNGAFLVIPLLYGRE
jgi:hypothetical protein